MIAVDPNKLFTICENLRHYSNMLASHAATLQGIQQGISSYGMAEISQLVIKSYNQIDEQIFSLHRLFRSVESICKIYASGEQRVTDSFENSIIHYYQPEAAFMDLTTSTEFLNEFSSGEVL